MKNEDTGEAIQCPHCGSEDDCSHLLAVIDRSFLWCSGGYAFSRFNEFHSAIEEAFLKRLQAGDVASPKWKDGRLQELWEYGTEEYGKTNEVWIDGDMLFRLIIDLLEDAGGEEYMGPIDDEGGPGYSSAITLFYAANPQSVFERSVSDLNDLLGNP
jgi:hypothetical protein